MNKSDSGNTGNSEKQHFNKVVREVSWRAKLPDNSTPSEKSVVSDPDSPRSKDFSEDELDDFIKSVLRHTTVQTRLVDEPDEP